MKVDRESVLANRRLQKAIVQSEEKLRSNKRKYAEVVGTNLRKEVEKISQCPGTQIVACQPCTEVSLQMACAGHCSADVDKIQRLGIERTPCPLPLEVYKREYEERAKRLKSKSVRACQKEFRRVAKERGIATDDGSVPKYVTHRKTCNGLCPKHSGTEQIMLFLKSVKWFLSALRGRHSKVQLADLQVLLEINVYVDGGLCISNTFVMPNRTIVCFD